MTISVIVKQYMRMISAIELEKSQAGTHILCIIVCKFRYLQEIRLVVLLPIDKALEVYFHNIFLSLCLAINLWMKGCK